MSYGKTSIFIEEPEYVYKGSGFQHSIYFINPKDFLKERYKKPDLFEDIFKYVKSQNRQKNYNSLKDVKIADWIEDNFEIEIHPNKPILDISYGDKNKDNIIPVLEKLSKKYNDYYNEFKNNSLRNEINALDSIIPDLSELDNESIYDEKEDPINSIRFGKILLLRSYEKEFKNYQTLLLRELKTYAEPKWPFIKYPEIEYLTVNNRIRVTFALSLIGGLFSGLFVTLLLESFDKKIYIKDDILFLNNNQLIDLNIRDIDLVKEKLSILTNSKLKNLQNKIGIISLGDEKSDSLKKVNVVLDNLMQGKIEFIKKYQTILDVENIIISIEKSFAKEKELKKLYEYIRIADKNLLCVIWIDS